MFLNILEVRSHKQILHSPKICTMNLAGDYKKKPFPSSDKGEVLTLPNCNYSR